MLLLTLIQIESTIWDKLADYGLSAILLGIAVYVLWKRDTAMNDKMNKYLDEDRKEMLTVINNNTRAFEDLAHTMKDLLVKTIN